MAVIQMNDRELARLRVMVDLADKRLKKGTQVGRASSVGRGAACPGTREVALLPPPPDREAAKNSRP